MKQSKRINPFFVEIIIVLLFLSFTCVILLQIFSSSAVLSKKSSDLNSAILKTQTYFETILSYKENQDVITILENGEINFDKNWKENSQADNYSLIPTYKTTENDTSVIYDISIKIVKENGEEVYNATLSKLIAK